MELLFKKSADDVLVTAVPYDNLEESNGWGNSASIQDFGSRSNFARRLFGSKVLSSASPTKFPSQTQPHQDESDSTVTDTCTDNTCDVSKNLFVSQCKLNPSQTGQGSSLLRRIAQTYHTTSVFNHNIAG
eukprot:GHVP01039401.1.p1 GENE.GHVP01039401.1~~GHVP01039401.1.p1  ORF type:complete len:130 (+),score=17.99 GHVP01039401.1:81-470(+)